MFKKIASTFANCFKIPELKSRILFTLGTLAVCRVISMLPIPGINGAELAKHFDDLASRNAGGGMVGMYSMFTGGALERCAIGALGIMPYISATIIIQLAQRGRAAFEQARPRRRRSREDRPIRSRA